MAKSRTKQADPFADLTWDDLEEWVDSRIISRGRKYQQQGRVSELATTSEGSLVAWVSGTHQYATKVVMEEYLPESLCTCPYRYDCKHGVAVVLEYLEQVGEGHRVPEASEDDDRLVLLEGVDEEFEEEEAGLPEAARLEIEPFLQGKSKAQLMDLLLELAQQHADIAQDLMDRREIASGSTRRLVTRLRQEIRNAGSEPGWQNQWHGEGYTPDYSGIRSKLNSLLEAGHADEVLNLGRELLIVGTRQVGESDDEGETSEEIASCVPLVAEALERSSLSPAAKLAWAVEAVLKDEYGLSASFEEYLNRRHPQEAWNTLTDQLLAQLRAFEPAGDADQFTRSFARDRLSDWAACALERAGRCDEVLPLYEAETRETNSYDRLVEWLIRRRRYNDAERWIQEGIQATVTNWPGIGEALREQFKTILTRRQDRQALAALEVEEFVHDPAQPAFADCQKACRKIGIWPEVRGHLLAYLETGVLPWDQQGWPLPSAGLPTRGPSARQSFPLVDALIEIAIQEKDPERVLYWYDRRPEHPSDGLWIEEDWIAAAIQTYAPGRAIAIWQRKAENLIAHVNPRSYDEAGRYLRKVGAVMAREGRQREWSQYLQDLRMAHTRKRRFIEVLDRLSGKRIAAKKR
jgi:uncharacterized Zn finger protein